MHKKRFLCILRNLHSKKITIQCGAQNDSSMALLWKPLSWLLRVFFFEHCLENSADQCVHESSCKWNLLLCSNNRMVSRINDYVGRRSADLVWNMSDEALWKFPLLSLCWILSTAPLWAIYANIIITWALQRRRRRAPGGELKFSSCQRM